MKIPSNNQHSLRAARNHDGVSDVSLTETGRVVVIAAPGVKDDPRLGQVKEFLHRSGFEDVQVATQPARARLPVDARRSYPARDKSALGDAAADALVERLVGSPADSLGSALRSELRRPREKTRSRRGEKRL